MSQGATVTPPATRIEGDARSETMEWLHSELDRAWASGDASRICLLAHLIDDVQCQMKERSAAAARYLFLKPPTTQQPLSVG